MLGAGVFSLPQNILVKLTHDKGQLLAMAIGLGARAFTDSDCCSTQPGRCILVLYALGLLLFLFAHRSGRGGVSLTQLEWLADGSWRFSAADWGSLYTAGHPAV